MLTIKINLSYLLCGILLISVARAQQINMYLQVDTVRIEDSPESKIFIFKVDTSEMVTKYGPNDLITHIEITDFNNNSFVQVINDTSERHSFAGGVVYIDINLDGQVDLDIDLGIFNLTPAHSFWLFDNSINKFYYSPEFSQLNDYSIDSSKKEIESHSQSTGGRGGYSEKYKIEKGGLSLIETKHSNFYNYEHQKVINGVLKTVELQKEEWLEDEMSKHLSLIETYKLVNDSLLLTEKSWLTGVDPRYQKDIEVNENIYNCGPWGGCLKYLRKEVYSYDTNKVSYAIKDTTRYQVINYKWEKVDVFTK